MISYAGTVTDYFMFDFFQLRVMQDSQKGSTVEVTPMQPALHPQLLAVHQGNYLL